MEWLLPGLDGAPNVHPMFVHFPIALWFTALGFWIAALFGRSEHLWRVGRWVLNLGVVGGAAAVATGLWAADLLGHESPGHDLVHVHRDFMLVAFGLALVTALVAHIGRRSGRLPRMIAIALLVGTVAVTTLGADRGAALVFRHGVGTESGAAAVSTDASHDATPPPEGERDHRIEHHTGHAH